MSASLHAKQAPGRSRLDPERQSGAVQHQSGAHVDLKSGRVARSSWWVGVDLRTYSPSPVTRQWRSRRAQGGAQGGAQSGAQGGARTGGTTTTKMPRGGTGCCWRW